MVFSRFICEAVNRVTLESDNIGTALVIEAHALSKHPFVVEPL